MERPEAILVVGERMVFPWAREIAWEEVNVIIFQIYLKCQKLVISSYV